GSRRDRVARAHRVARGRRRRPARRSARSGAVQGTPEMSRETTTAVDRIRAVFADAGCSGWLHARRCLHTPGSTASNTPAPNTPAPETREATLSVHGDERVVLASVYKLPLLLTYCALVDAG